LVARIHQLILQHPTFGYRGVWALLRYGEGQLVNRKRVYRLMKLRGWMLHQRQVTPKPRVQKLRSRAEASNQR
jgi:putative transposase